MAFTIVFVLERFVALLMRPKNVMRFQLVLSDLGQGSNFVSLGIAPKLKPHKSNYMNNKS